MQLTSAFDVTSSGIAFTLILLFYLFQSYNVKITVLRLKKSLYTALYMASTSRNRHIGRSYKSGHEKRKNTAVEENWQREDISPKLQNSSIDQGKGWNLQMIYE